jgi:biotin carboxylase/CelD/BcsL family acetyltransferase involved in cellulose biosynthesis
MSTNGYFALLESDPFGASTRFAERARDLGLRPILLTTDPGNSSSGKLERLSIFKMSRRAVIDAVNRLGRDQVRGVWSLQDSLAETAAHVALAIGCQGADPEAIRVCADKLKTRQTLAQAGIKDVEFALARSAREAAAAACALGAPVVVKPRFSTGSFGVRLCRSEGEARKHFNTLAERLPNLQHSGVLIEAAVVGQQFSVQIFDGRSIGVTRQSVGSPPAFITVELDFPWCGDTHIHRQIVEHAESAVAAAGCVRGPVSVDLRYDSQGPHIIEINPRLAGDMIPENVFLATGIDLIDATVRFACGLHYSLEPSRNRGSATRWLLRPDHAVSDVLGCDEAAKVPGVVKVRSFPNWCTREGAATNYKDRLAFVIAEAETWGKAGEVAQAGLQHLRVNRLKNGFKNPLADILPSNGLIPLFRSVLGWQKEQSACLSYSIVSDGKSFDALGPEWENLFARAAKQTPFLRYSWLQQCWERQRKDLRKQLFVVIIRKDDRAVLMAPLVMRSRSRAWQLAFLDSLTPQYNDVLVEDSLVADGAVRYLWESLTSLRGVRWFSLDWLQDDSALSRYLKKAKQACRLKRFKARFIDLSSFKGWDDYIHHLPKSLRQDHGRQLRNLNKCGNFEFRMSDPSNYASDMAWLFARKREWVDRKEKSPWIKAPGTEEFYTAAAREGLESGRTWLTTLTLSGETIAAMLSFREESTLYFSKITYNPVWHVFSPARTLLLLTIRRAFEESITKCDLMTGRGDWKDTLATGTTVVRNLTLMLSSV